MPGTNGINVAKQFATLNPASKILFMSDFIGPSLAHKGNPESEYAFFQKPFAPNVLVKKMRKVLSGPNGLKQLDDFLPG